MVFHHFYGDARKNSLSGHKKRFCLYACCWIALASALWLRCLFFFSTAAHFPFPLPIYICFWVFFQPLASPEGIQALSGATSPYAGRLKQTVQTRALNSTGIVVRWFLINMEVDFCQLSLLCLHLSVNWQPAQLYRWFSATNGGVPGRTWPREDLNCGTSAHKKTQRAVFSRGSSTSRLPF